MGAENRGYEDKSSHCLSYDTERQDTGVECLAPVPLDEGRNLAER